MNALCRPFIVLLLFVSSNSFGAEGVRTLPDSSEALGKVGGRIATLGDPSVTRTNPASLLDLEGTQFQFNFQAWHGDSDFTQRGTGLRESMIEPWKPTGSIYLTHQLNENLTAGLGISAPFGLSINWAQAGLFRYVTPYDTVLQTVAVNPAIAFQVNDKMSVGVGLDVYVSRLQMDQAYSWSAATGGFPFPDGGMTFEGTGVGLGGYLGVNYQITPRQRISVVGRLPVKVDYDGDFDISNIPAPLAGTFSRRSSFTSEVEHPGSIGVGYGIDLPNDWTLGFDFEWLQNSTHDDLPLLIGANQPLLGGATTLPMQWKDSISAGMGLSRKMSDQITLRTGYLFSETPMIDRTFTPAVPANDRHIFSFGAGYQRERGTIDFAYSYIHMNDRSVSGNPTPGLNGNYEFGWNIFSLSYIRKF